MAMNHSKASSILVIDDESIVQESCKRILVPEGYTVESAYTAQEGLGRLADACFDLVITDLKMPGISGMEALKKIKHDDPDIGIIMITGYSTAETAVEAMKLGAFDYLPKPFTPDELMAAVSHALEKKRLLLETKHLEKAYRDATAAISSSLNLNEVLTLITRSVVSLLKFKACSVHLLDEENKTLKIRACSGLSDTYLEQASHGIDDALQEAFAGRTVYIPDARNDGRISHQVEVRSEGIISMLTIPLKVKHGVIGALRAYTGDAHYFDEKESDLLQKLAAQAGIAVTNARLYQEVKQDYESLRKDLPLQLKDRTP
jgi:DNA-binding response OmpR family regulator